MKFSDALDRKVEDIKRPPNLPTGHYTWQVDKVPEMEEFESRAGDQFEKLTFSLRCVEPSEDVDPDELSDFGNVAGALQRKQFFFPTSEESKASFERSMFNLRRFLDDLGVDANVELSEALNLAVGAQCLGELTHRPDPNDAEIIYAEVGRTAPV